MNKVLSIILFPFLWISMYTYRIIWYDIIDTIIKVLCNFISPLVSLWHLITLPFILIWEIPVGLVITFIVAFDASREIFVGETDVSGAIKSSFAKKQ